MSWFGAAPVDTHTEQDVEEEAGRALLTLPGILGFFTRSQLLRGQLPPTEAARAVARSYFPPRGGDVVLVTAPFYFWGKYGEKDQGSTHGSFYRYDTDVPVFFLGPWFAAGDYGVIAVDHAYTLVVGMRSMPGNPYDGHTLAETLEQVGIVTGTDKLPTTAIVDKGYRGAQIEGVRILMSGQKRGITRTLKAMIKRT